MIATLFFSFFEGAGLSSALAAVSAKARKPKRRKFVFDNGITVWATSEAMARLVAGLETAAPEVPVVEAIPIRPKRAKAVAPTLPTGPTAAVIAAEQARVVIELREIEARLRRLRADEEAIILHLLMDEAA
jgi:hypothetical protein